MRYVPRAKVTSRTVTVRQYRTEAQYVPMAEANGMRANHVSGTPRTAKTSQTTLRERESIGGDVLL